MANHPNIVGMDTLLKRFEQMPENVQRELIATGLLRGPVSFHDAVRNNAPYRRGYLRRSVKMKISRIGRRGTGPSAEVRIRAFYAKFIEFGADPHWIQARDSELRQAFSEQEVAVLKQAGAKALRFGDFFGVRVWHPGIRGRGFMRRSWDETNVKAIDEIRRSIRNAILYTKVR
jgi:HK97 gp10 family phage protein